MKTDKKIMRVCFVAHSALNAGGGEKGFWKLIEALHNRGVKTTVVFPSKGPAVELIKKNKIPYIILPYKRWINPKLSLIGKTTRAILSLAMVFPLIFKILLWRSQIVYTNTSTVYAGAIAAKLTTRPHIWHFKEFALEDYGWEYDFSPKFIQYLTNKLSTICLINSYALADKYRTFIQADKVKIIYEAYDIQLKKNQNNTDFEKKYLQDSGFICSIIGTIHEGKGQTSAIYAINELKNSGAKIKLFIIGDGLQSYKDYILSIVNKLGLTEEIIFLGHIEYSQYVMSKSDVILVCSRKEAYGLVTLEAMQVGKPVIGSRSGGTVELVKEGFNGLLYEPGNYHDLAKKILHLYKNPQLVIEMGENGRKWVNENFRFEKYVDETYKVLEDILHSY